MDPRHVIDVGVFLSADLLLTRQGGKLCLLLIGQLGFHQRACAPLGLPSGGQSSRPVGIGGPVVPDVNGRGGALEHIELLGRGAEAGNGLDRRGSRADDAHNFVCQTRQVLLGVGVVPARGVKGVPLEKLHTLDLRQLGLGESAVGADHEPRPHVVAPVRGDVPHLFGVVPHGGSDGCPKSSELIQVILPGDGLAVGVDLWALGVAVLGHVVHLVEQGQVVIGRHVARHTGVPVPVPRPAHVRSPLHDADTLDAILPEPRGGEERRKPSPDEQAFDGIIDGLAGRDLASVGVDLILRQRTCEIGRVLRRAFRAVFQPQVALLGELLLDAIIVFLRLCGLRREHVKSADDLGLWYILRLLHLHTLVLSQCA